MAKPDESLDWEGWPQTKEYKDWVNGLSPTGKTEHDKLMDKVTDPKRLDEHGMPHRSSLFKPVTGTKRRSGTIFEARKLGPGSGMRIYVQRIKAIGGTITKLLGGTKDTQQKDIRDAERIADDIESYRRGLDGRPVQPHRPERPSRGR